MIVAGSANPEFPREAHRLLLGIAANDATIALQRWQAQAAQRRFVAAIERSSSSSDSRTSMASHNILTLRPSSCSVFLASSKR